MSARGASLEDVRFTVARALGDDRLASIQGDAPLWQAGLISSIELVGVVLALEEQYGVRVPDSQVTPKTFASLNAICRLLNSLGSGEVSSPAAGEPAMDSVRRVLRRPLRLVVIAVIFLSCIDAGLRVLISSATHEYARFLEDGARLYPYSGAFSHDDFAFAIAQHAVRKAPSRTRVNVLVLGDSGTFGSYLPASQAIPCHIGRSLEQRGSNLRALNLAFFGRLLVKDLMLLELTLDDSTRVVIFTVGADSFRKPAVTRWVDAFQHSSFNWLHFQRFRMRIPPAEAAPFTEMEQALREADLRHLGPLRRLLYAHTALHYRPFIQYWLQVKLLPLQWGSPMKWDMSQVAEQRVFVKGPAQDVTDVVTPEELDERQVALLASTVRYLRSEGVGVVLFVEPAGPRSWQSSPGSGIRAVSIAEQVAAKTGAVVVDESWSLEADAFLDSTAHYTASANRRLGERLAGAVVEAAGN